MLIEAAERAPSHFNSQPWRFVLIDDPTIKSRIASIGGRTMTQLIEGGSFFTRYRKYFRFSDAEMEERRDGILIDKMPMALRPFIKQVFTDNVMSVLSKLGVASMLGEDNRKLIEGSPLQGPLDIEKRHSWNECIEELHPRSRGARPICHHRQEQ